MKAILIHPSSGGFGEYDLGADAFSIPLKGLIRRKDIEGLVHNGGPGGEYTWGRVYEDENGSLMVRVA